MFIIQDKTLEISIISGLLSVAGSGFVLLTCLLFPSMIKRKIYMHCVFMIYLHDFFASAAFSIGFPSDYLCEFQGWVTCFCFRGSWFWTLFLSFQLYSLIMFRCPKLSIYKMHIFYWPFNLLLELLPLTTNSYGIDDEFGSRGDASCWLRLYPNHEDGETWNWITFLGPLILCIIFMLFLCYIILRKWNKSGTFVIKSCIKALFYYPMLMLIAWIPNTIFVLLHYYGETFEFKITYAFATLNGFFQAIFFIHNSTEAKYRWKMLFLDLFYYLFPKQIEEEAMNDEIEVLVEDFEENDESDDRMSEGIRMSDFVLNMFHDNDNYETNSFVNRPANDITNQDLIIN